MHMACNFILRISVLTGCSLTLCHKSEALKPRLDHAAGAYPGFRSMKRLGVYLLPLVPRNSPVPIYTPAWREAL